MITKIQKVKNLGIFSDYQWTPDLPEFKRYNLIYGWNGSGKTTLSQLFSSFNTGKADSFPNLEYKIQSGEGDYIQGTPYIKQIRVFNRDYIADNIDIAGGKAKPIFILGKENKELAETIKQEEKILKGDPEKKDDIGKIKELELKKKEFERKENDKGKVFTNVAKIISTNTSGVTARNYRKTNAEQAFSLLKTKQLLSEDEVSKYLLTLKQQEKPLLSLLSIGSIEKDIIEAINTAEKLLQSTIKTVLIQRLKENPDISRWVEQGIELHTTKKSSNCEFCARPLPETRISELLAYFNEADRKIKNDIDLLINNIAQITTSIRNVNTLDKANLYDEMQQKYLSKTDSFLKCKNELLSQIAAINKCLEKKKINTSTPLKLDAGINPAPFINALKALNEEIGGHNKKTNNFTQAKTEANDKLGNHYLSEIFDEVANLDLEIGKIKHEINILENGDPHNPAIQSIPVIQQRIADNKSKISTSGPACEEINRDLKTFLGRDELTFEVTDGGYLIKRKDKIAKNLSEGEKTAIAFVYFTIHLKDQDFNASDGIIIVDDPICSLDSNSLYQAYAFLRNAVKNAAQVFIFTHNFDFLRLLIGWLNFRDNVPYRQYYMVNNPISENKRIAKIESLDELLEKHDSEYQYLFKLIYKFRSVGTIASVYHIPNIARKLLESFLMIMIPNSKSIYHKLMALDFDDNKKTAIYKFTNDQSHMTGKGFDPSLVPECQNNVSFILEMIESVFPGHYKILVEASN